MSGGQKRPLLDDTRDSSSREVSWVSNKFTSRSLEVGVIRTQYINVHVAVFVEIIHRCVLYFLKSSFYLEL